MTPLHVQNYCYASTGACKYVESSYNAVSGKSVFLCTKLSPIAYQKLIKNPYGVGTDDNCPGYLYLKNLEQGFDVDKKKKT